MGWFDVQKTNRQAAQRVHETGLRIHFKPLPDGSFEIDATGSNQYGDFKFKGTAGAPVRNRMIMEVLDAP